MKCHVLFFLDPFSLLYFFVLVHLSGNSTEKQQIITQEQEWAMADHPKSGSCSDLKFEVQVWRSCPVFPQLGAGEANLLLRHEKK